jgi:ferritin-like metal-binding protein YciE
MKMNNLHELYVEELKDLHDAEKQLVKALPKMAKAAKHPELKQAFENHLEETRRHVERLETILGELDELGRGKKCKGMEGLIEEGKELIEEEPEEDVLDAGLISKAQHVEHYEMAGYGTVRTYAQLMGHTRHAELLQTTLDEEGAADKLLTALAESSINAEANDESDTGEEEESRRGNGRSNGAKRKRSSGSRGRSAASSRWKGGNRARSGGAKKSGARRKSTR